MIKNEMCDNNFKVQFIKMYFIINYSKVYSEK